MKNIFNFLKNMKNDIGEPPWKYDFLLNLEESEYPIYLAKIFKYRTGEDLPLKKLGSLEAWKFGGCKMGKAFFSLFNKSKSDEKAYPRGQGQWGIDKEKCKTFNQKIQWIKLYGITDLMRRCTDKVAVCDYVAERIGSEYLKPVLQIIPEQKALSVEPSLRQISRWRDFSSLTDEGADLSAGTTTFTVPWQSSRLDENMLLSNDVSTLTDASSQLDCHGLNRPRSDEETDDLQSNLNEEIKPTNCSQSVSTSDNPSPENLTLVPRVDFLPSPAGGGAVRKSSRSLLPTGEGAVVSEVTSVTNAGEGFDTSKTDTFNFVRVDWMIYQNKLYFEELTFTPYSGLRKFDTKKNDLKLGSWINLKENGHGF